MKNYIGFSRDHSGSMRHIAHVAMKDFNEQLDLIKNEALKNNQDTIVSVVKIGHGRSAIVHREIMNSNVQVVKPLTKYEADAGGTPLLDSIMELISLMENVPDANNPDVSFLLMITTDGQENASKVSPFVVAKKIKELVNSDRWSFVFRVPRHGARDLRNAGIDVSMVSVLEWDQTESGVKASTETNKEAFTKYFSDRTMGLKSTRSFYADLSSLTKEEVKQNLVNIAGQVSLVHNTQEKTIQEFADLHFSSLYGTPYLKGMAYYQLVKTERKVQPSKSIVIRDKMTGEYYSGASARQLIGLPTGTYARLVPANLGNYDVFIQSTSLTRLLPSNSYILFWPGSPNVKQPSKRRR